MVFKNPIRLLANGVFYGLIFVAFNITQVSAAPFLTTDQNPFSQIHALPLPSNAKLLSKNQYSFNIALELTNTLNSQSNASETLLLDFESYHLKPVYNVGLGNGWAGQIYVPLIYRGGGRFDQAIDSWHEFFHLPRASRPNVTNNQYQISYRKNGTNVINLTQSDSQIGDIQLSIAKQLSTSSSFSSSLWATIDLPTGDANSLTGNEKVDVSFHLANSWQHSAALNYFSNIGVQFTSGNVFQNLATEPNIWFGVVGLNWALSTDTELQLQINAHTNYFKGSSLPLLGDTYELLFGGVINFNRCSQLEIVFSEDIKVGAAPDISLQVGWRRLFGECGWH